MMLRPYPMCREPMVARRQRQAGQSAVGPQREQTYEQRTPTGFNGRGLAAEPLQSCETSPSGYGLIL